MNGPRKTAPKKNRPVPGLVDQAEYLLDLGSTLLSYGCPTYRLEALIREIAILEGFVCDVFAVPTGLWMMLRRTDQEAPVVRMVRVKEWGVNLDRLAVVDRIFNDVLEKKCTLSQARRAIDEVEKRPPPFPPKLAWIATPVATASSAVFFRGGWGEVLAALFGGTLLALIMMALRRRETTSLLSEFLGGIVAGGVACSATALRPELSREVLVLSGVIVLVPGMALTTGLAELANRNLVSGAARLMGAMIAFLSIVFGIAAVIALERMIGASHLTPSLRSEPPLWLELGALLAASFAFCVMFSVPRQFLPAAMSSGALAWVATGLGTRHLPSGLAPFVASVCVCLFANGCARWSQRPAQVFLLPGLVLLVPGSFGFLSLEAFLRGDFIDGAAKGFEMFLIAGALVTGFLLANVVLPARKFL